MPQGHPTSREYAEQLIAEYQSSGLSRQQFCTSHNIKVGTFHWWIKRQNDAKSREKAIQSSFIQLPSMSSGAPGDRVDGDLTIDFPSGARLKWHGTMLPQAVSQLLESMGRSVRS